MKIENAIAHVTRTIKDYKSQPFITCTPLFESMCEEFIKLLSDKEKEEPDLLQSVQCGWQDISTFLQEH